LPATKRETNDTRTVAAIKHYFHHKGFEMQELTGAALFHGA